MKKSVLLICPPATIGVYGRKKVVVPHIPYLSLASLAGALLRAGHDAHILDLSVSSDVEKDLSAALAEYNPDFAGITFTTPLANIAVDLSKKIKEKKPNISLLCGGVHTTTLPEETLKNSAFNIACIGEGEETILEIVGGKNLKDILGIAYKTADGAIQMNPRRPLLDDLDKLPYPAWHLYDVKKYHTARIVTKKSRVGAIETSRGCVFSCSFCNKTVFNRFWRAKSSERVVDELEYMLKFGFQEIHFWDDGFSTDIERAKEVCRLIIKRKLKFFWNTFSGIRADRVDEELLRLMKEAGCYGTSMGIESGNQEIINIMGKSTTLDTIRRAVKLIKEAGLVSTGFFIMGLDGETEKTLQDTIDFAKELKLDFPKVMIAVPLPGTPLFNKWSAEGRVKSYDWSRYVFHPEEGLVYEHPNLKFETIYKYYNKFYRELYFSSAFILRRFWRDLKTGDLFIDAYYFFKVLFGGWIKFN